MKRTKTRVTRVGMRITASADTGGVPAGTSGTVLGVDPHHRYVVWDHVVAEAVSYDDYAGARTGYDMPEVPDWVPGGWTLPYAGPYAVGDAMGPEAEWLPLHPDHPPPPVGTPVKVQRGPDYDERWHDGFLGATSDAVDTPMYVILPDGETAWLPRLAVLFRAVDEIVELEVGDVIGVTSRLEHLDLDAGTYRVEEVDYNDGGSRWMVEGYSWLGYSDMFHIDLDPSTGVEVTESEPALESPGLATEPASKPDRSAALMDRLRRSR